MHLRLALATILNAKHGQFTLLAGIVCSSWTTINMATSGRTPCTPLGREDDREYVALANRMAARSFGHTFKEAFQLLYFMLNISCISKLLYIPMTNILSPGKSFRQVPWNHSYIYIYMSMRSAPPGAAHGSSAFSHLEHKSSLQHMHTIRPAWSWMGSDFTLLQIQK